MDKSLVTVNQVAVPSSNCYEFSNPNEAEVVELEDDLVDVVERKMEDLKLDHQFNEKYVPKIFQTLINEQIDSIKLIIVYFCDKKCTMKFGNEEVLYIGVKVCLEKVENDWMIYYGNSEDTIKTDNPEKSIVDHLWFILKNPKIKLSVFEMHTNFGVDTKGGLMSSEKTELLLQSMLQFIDHQMHISEIWLSQFSEDMFLSMLKRLEPEVLNGITLDFPWRKIDNLPKMKEIVETEQWKKAKTINSCGNVPLKIEDLLHYEEFDLPLDDITPEDVLLVSEHYFNSTGYKRCSLYGRFSIRDILKAFHNEGSRITKSKPTGFANKFCYKIVKSEKSLLLSGCQDFISIELR